MKFKIFLTTIISIFCVLFAQDETALYNQPSQKELYSRAREILKNSLENGDLEKGRQALEYLQSKVSSGAPLEKSEEFQIYFELGEYEKGITLYEDAVHAELDPAYHPKAELRNSVNDALSQYLQKKWSSKDNVQNKIRQDSLVNIVNHSEAKQQQKDLFSTLIHLNLLDYIQFKDGDFVNIEDTMQVHQFIDEANQYCEKYPNTDAGIYLKENVIPNVKKHLKQMDDYRRDPLIYNYYTGGLSFYVGKWLIGLLSGNATEYLKDSRGTSLMLEAELQIRRIAFTGFYTFGLITKPKYDKKFWDTHEDESIGLTLGYVAYDTRFLKVTPFIGYGSTVLTTVDEEIEPQIILGVNVDSHLWFSKPFDFLFASFGFNARFKYMMQIGELKDYSGKEDIKATTVHHTFALELGIALW